MLTLKVFRYLLQCVVLIATLLIFPMRILANQSDQEVQVSSLLARIQVSESSLQELGLSFKDFKGFEPKGSSFYDSSYSQEYHSQILPEINNMNLEQIEKKYRESVEASKKEANKWIYASKIAAINQKRDPNFTNLSHETVYLYLSHFIDIKTGVLDKVNPYYSDNVYYSAWIVNDDRRTYDTFLNGILQQTQADFYLSAHEQRGIFLSILTRGQKYSEDVQALYRIYKYSTYLKMTTENPSIDWKKLIKHTEKLYNQSDNFKMFSELLSRYMEEEDYSDLITDYFKKIIMDSQSMGELFSASGIADYFEQIQLKIGHGMIQKFRWIALVQYNGIRVSQRMMRYYSE